jgi:hypothetical protein
MMDGVARHLPETILAERFTGVGIHIEAESIQT